MTHLFLSFWDICLENLPHGQFLHNTISATEAVQVIRLTRERFSASATRICWHRIGQRSGDVTRSCAPYFAIGMAAPCSLRTS